MTCGVAILFTDGATIVFDKIAHDTEGRIIIASIQFNGQRLLLTNLYNDNDQKSQLETLSTLKIESFASRNFRGYKLSRTPIFKIKFCGD